MFGLGLAFLHKRNAGSAGERAVAIENGQVHQRVVENVSHDRGERLPAVNMRKAFVTGKARRREQHNAAEVGKILVMEASCLMRFRMLRTYSGGGNDLSVRRSFSTMIARMSAA